MHSKGAWLAFLLSCSVSHKPCDLDKMTIEINRREIIILAQIQRRTGIKSSFTFAVKPTKSKLESIPYAARMEILDDYRRRAMGLRPSRTTSWPTTIQRPVVRLGRPAASAATRAFWRKMYAI